MSVEFELLSPTDKPALLAVNTAETMETCKTVLGELGFKVHVAANAEEFSTRFPQAAYQLVIVEESSNPPEEGSALKNLQHMAMSQRRHATIVLIGDSFQTLHNMQAFQQSVHAVVNRSDFGRLSEILQKVLADTDQFYQVFRDIQLHMAEGS